MFQPTYPYYLANQPCQPNTDLSVTDKFTGEVVTRVALADADVVFINGALLEEGLLEAIENAGGDANVVTASSCVQILALGEHDHEEGDEHEGRRRRAIRSSAADCESRRAQFHKGLVWM